jgi:integrase
MPKTYNRTYKLTYRPAQKRWQKFHQGKYHYFYAGDLGKVDSYPLALAWWESKKATLETPKPDPKLSLWLKTYLAYRQSQVGLNLSKNRYSSSASALQTFANWFALSPAPISELTLEGYWLFISSKVATKEWSRSYGNDLFQHVRLFVAWLVEMNLVSSPKNLNSKRYRFRIGPKVIKTIPLDQVQACLKNASDETRLFILLGLNCGFTSKDILDLRQDEVDWELGIIRRRRSKAEYVENAPVVSYKLWKTTFELLKRFRSEGEHVIEVSFEQKIQKSFARLGSGFSFKHLRKTAASFLNEQYPQFTQYFLGHSPKSVAETHYTKPSYQEFCIALEWLRSRIDL